MVELLVTGGSGLVGSAVRRLLPEDFDAVFIGSKDYDLTNPTKARKMIRDFKPKKIIHLAAKVGGVKANTEKVADFFNENVLINTNVLMAADKYDVQHVVSMLSTCVYPDVEWVTYPLTEVQLHKGPPHDSNFGYAYAKRMLEVQSRAYRKQKGRNYITAIPNNIYGPHDNFDLENGHVVPAVIRKVHEAKLNNKSVSFWGDGSPLREFTFSEDVAAVLLKMIGCPNGSVYDSEFPCNIGNNEEISIKELVETVVDIVGFTGDIVWDTTKPSGQYRKPSQASRITHEYKSLKQGLEITYKWFRTNYPNVRGVR